MGESKEQFLDNALQMNEQQFPLMMSKYVSNCADMGRRTRLVWAI